MKKIFYFFFVFIIQSQITFAQIKIALYEDSLKTLGVSITSDSLELNRVQANYTFIKTLVNALKEKSSFNYPFNQLNDFVAIKKSDDNKFRLFTWFIQKDDGTYRYYGAVQMNNPNQLELYPLVDNTQNLKLVNNLADTALATNQWLGAVYYHILPVLGIKDPYYILFGWKGKNLQSNTKVIETLSFKSGKPVFGTQVLENGPKSNHFNTRMIFDYTKDASMLLRYVKDDRMIVFDHLVPPNDESKGMTDLYAPDLSYDGYRFKLGKWVFQENLKLKNLPDESDDIFIDPAKDNQNIRPVIKN